MSENPENSGCVSLKAILASNLFFRGLPDNVILRVAALAKRHNFPAGAVIFDQGDFGDALYCVVAGRVRISASGPEGREVFLNIMEPGNVFGEIAVIDGLPRTARAVTSGSATLVAIERSDFLALLEEEPALAKHLLVLFCQRLRWTSDLVEESAFLEGPARLARRLLVLADQHATATPAGLSLRLSQSELAHFLGISRQFVNQNLQSWRAQGWVELSRGQVTICDVAALERVANDSGSDTGSESED